VNSFQILSDKFSAAPLPTICAPRLGVLNLIQRESSKRVVYISAPAGYGKTVSTLLWLRNSGRVPIWIGLDEFDNTLPIFYKLFCTGVLSVQPENSARADILRSPAFDSSPVEHTIRLLSEFTPDDRQYAVVLDDMHLITNEQIRESGLLVQKRLPQSFVVLVLTRNEVAQKYIEITGQEKLTVIDSKDLAFSSEEIRRYFVEYGNFITAEEASEIHNLTNGWAIGINALAISGQVELGQSRNDVLEGYIKGQLWDKLDDDLRDFILRSSVVDEMTPELCNKLTGCANSEEILESLRTKNFFVSKTGNGSFRYHRLFLDFLRDRAEGTGLDLRELYKLAAEYYKEKGEYLKTRLYAVKSDDTETIVRMVYSFAPNASPSIDEYVNSSKILNRDLLSESICNRYPFLYTSHIAYCFLIGNARGVEQYLDRLYAYLPVITKNFPKHLSMCVMQLSLDYRVLFSEQMRFFEQLTSATSKKSAPHMVSLTMQMPFLHRSSRDFFELRDEKLAKKAQMVFGALLRANSKVIIGGIRSGLLLEQNHLKDAMDKALCINELVDESTSGELRYAVLLHLAAVYCATGDSHRLGEMMDKTERYFEESGTHYLRPNFLAYKIKIVLWDGDKHAAATWLENYFVAEAEQLEFYKIFQHFTTARAYIVLAQTNKALHYIGKLKKLGNDFHRPLDIAEASVLQAVLEWAMGNKKEALKTLEEALTPMQEYGFVRVFADEGAAVFPILKKLASNLQKVNYQGSLDVHFLNRVTIAAYEQAKRYKGIAINIRASKPVKLSKQQKHVIALLSKGYKNAEIVKMTGLTIHTIKSHQAAAYAKLDVNSAMDAVLKAKELGLIE